MTVTIVNFFDRARKCPFACFLKLLLFFSFIYTIHIATYHQSDVSPYSYIWLVDAVGVIAILALAFHLNCPSHNVEKK